MRKFSIVFLTLMLSITFMSMVAQPDKDLGDLGRLDAPPQAPQAQMERSPGQFDVVKYKNDMSALYESLVAQAASFPGELISVEVSASDIQKLEDAECTDCGDGVQAKTKLTRVGLVKEVNRNINLNRMVTENLSGATAIRNIRAMNDGGYVWTQVIESPTASGMRVHLENFNLPANAELYIYNNNGGAFGPYTGMGPGNRGEFWTNTLSGSVIYLQVRQHGSPSADALKSTNFNIADVAYLGEKWLMPFIQKKVDQEGLSGTQDFCNFNEPCVENASCTSSGAVSTAKDAVAHMQWIQGAFIYICSGGLVADSDNGSQIPYFITANHCISKSKPANSLECFWQFTTNCNGSCYDPDGAVPRTLGASILSTNRTSDYTLMLLDENPPGGSAFLGWDSSPIAFNNGANLYRISHPGGAPQAYSHHQVDTNKGTCSGWPRGAWIYSTDITGATEGGSSGSPVVNSSGQLVGQLTGGCGTNVNDVCDTESNATVDGAFANYYNSVSQWLGNGGNPGGGTEMHVSNIVLSTKVKGPRTDAKAMVTIVDENGDPVSGATVSGTFSGDASGSDSGSTNSSGQVELKVTVNGSVSSFGFCVDNVSGSLTYVPADNVETCDNY